MSGDPFESCALTVRRTDPDRYFSALFAPAAVRPHLFALYAFNHDIARIGERVREPMMGEIRLQWWRETLAGARAGHPRSHEVARALAETFSRTVLEPDLFEAMLEARTFDLSDESFAGDAARDAYLDATSANLMRLAARILGAGGSHDALAREAGLAYGLAGLVRNQARGAVRRPFLPAIGAANAVHDAREHLARARSLARPKKIIAAFLPAALVPLYLRDPQKDVPLHRRQLRLLHAGMQGRI